MLFQVRPVRVPFSKSTVFEICRQKMCRFRVNGRLIHQIFHRFQNMPASCEHSLILLSLGGFNSFLTSYEFIWLLFFYRSNSILSRDYNAFVASVVLS